MSEPSTKPYLIRAIYDWCCDAGYTPYLAVQVDEYTQVPMAYVKDGKIVLNIGVDAVRNLDQEQATQQQAPETPLGGLNTLGFLATISVALGFTNLLPIPALDGGRILFVLPEILLRRRVPAQYENMIHLIGFMALILLMIYVTAQDIINPVVLP